MDQEILRLSIRKMSGGVVFCREWAFCSDHSVYTRVTNLDTNESLGWQACVEWADLDQVRIMAGKMVNKGWEAVWNPNYLTGAEYLRSVTCS